MIIQFRLLESDQRKWELVKNLPVLPGSSKAIKMKKILCSTTGIILLSSIFSLSAIADETVEELQMAEGLNCPCKAEVEVPPPPPPPPPPPSKNPYYGGLEAFGLSKNMLDGGDNVTSKGSPLAGPFATDSTLRNIDDATEEFRMGGGRLTVGRYWDDRNALEFTAMGFTHNSDSFVEDTTGNNDINAAWENTGGGFLPAGAIFAHEFENANSQRLDSDTMFISGELNHRIDLNRMFSTTHGIRYAYFGDDIHFVSQDPVDGTGVLDLDATNHLIGLQVGVDMDIPLVSKLSAVGGVKVGGFLNIADIESRIYDDDGNSVSFDDTDIRGSAITEGNLGMTWKFTDSMSASLGYMAMMLSWVTSAGEQFPQANSAQEFQKHDTDHVLVHGPLARFNVTFD